MSELTATGGIDIGGSGDWSSGEIGERCQAEVVSHGLTSFLDLLTGHISGWWKIGLYANDHKPVLLDTIGSFEECTFSGYDGPKLVYLWSSATLVGIRAQSTAMALQWTHDGGPVANSVYGYFCVDENGLLTFAERFCDGPTIVDRAGRFVKVFPLMGLFNEREES